MLTSIYALLFGLTLGFILGVVAKFLLKPIDAPKDVIDSMLGDFKPKNKGDFIKVNKAETILKEHSGDLSIDDILEYDE